MAWWALEQRKWYPLVTSHLRRRIDSPEVCRVGEKGITPPVSLGEQEKCLWPTHWSLTLTSYGVECSRPVVSSVTQEPRFRETICTDSALIPELCGGVWRGGSSPTETDERGSWLVGPWRLEKKAVRPPLIGHGKWAKLQGKKCVIFYIPAYLFMFSIYI